MIIFKKKKKKTNTIHFCDQYFFMVIEFSFSESHYAPLQVNISIATPLLSVLTEKLKMVASVCVATLFVSCINADHVLQIKR